MDTCPIQKVIDIVGLAPLARELGVTYQAIRRWQKQGRLPRTEWTGETEYASTMEKLSGGQVTREQLLAVLPSSGGAAGRSAKPKPAPADLFTEGRSHAA